MVAPAQARGGTRSSPSSPHSSPAESRGGLPRALPQLRGDPKGVAARACAMAPAPPQRVCASPQRPTTLSMATSGWLLGFGVALQFGLAGGLEVPLLQCPLSKGFYSLSSLVSLCTVMYVMWAPEPGTLSSRDTVLQPALFALQTRFLGNVRN